MSNRKITIIAEAGVNHNGSIELAKELIDIAAESGADAVKFQTYITDDVLIKSTPLVKYQLTSCGEVSQYDLIKSLELRHDDFVNLKDYCITRNIEFLSTPFDVKSLLFLVNDLSMSHIKIASNEITNGPLLFAAAKTGKPIILSTGMSNIREIHDALALIAFGYIGTADTVSENALKTAYESKIGKTALEVNVSLLHCTSEYPAEFRNINLNAINTLRDCFHLAIGYSDHTRGIEIPIAAAAMGVTIIEKHFTKSRKLEGPDHQASLEPHELKKMIRSIRNVEIAMGDGKKLPAECELENMKIMRRSLVAKARINCGEAFSSSNLTTKQPGIGISPMKYWQYLGKISEKNYLRDEII